jgi:hypothetical protein
VKRSFDILKPVFEDKRVVCVSYVRTSMWLVVLVVVPGDKKNVFWK